MLLMRIAMAAAIHHAADVVTATVRPGHQPFYARWLHMKLMADPRPYPPLLHPLGLMTAQFQREMAAVLGKVEHLRPTQGETEALFGRSTDRTTSAINPSI
jgi:hypothetical protein